MSRSGFTLTELVVVLGIIGVLFAFGMPRFSDWLVRESVRSARRQVTTQLARVRALSVHRGCPAVLHLDDRTSRVWVTACRVQGTGTETVGTIDSLLDRFGASFQADGDSVLFTPQGLALNTSSIFLTFSKGEYSSSLEITPVGRPVW